MMRITLTLAAAGIFCSTLVGTQDLTNENNRADETEEGLYIRFRGETLNSLCPGDKPGKDCICEHNPDLTVSGPFDWKRQAARFGLLTLIGCSPTTCKCDDGQTVESRPEEIMRVMGLCEFGKMDRCLCHDKKKVVRYRERDGKIKGFDIKTFYFDCRPTRCKCSDSDEPKIIQSFGCKTGGFPYCAHKNDFICSDGTRVNRTRVLQTKIEGGCVCEDGIAPTCSTGEPLKCPDGSDIDYTYGEPGSYYSTCDDQLPKMQAAGRTIDYKF